MRLHLQCRPHSLRDSGLELGAVVRPDDTGHLDLRVPTKKPRLYFWQRLPSSSVVIPKDVRWCYHLGMLYLYFLGVDKLGLCHSEGKGFDMRGMTCIPHLTTRKVTETLPSVLSSSMSQAHSRLLVKSTSSRRAHLSPDGGTIILMSTPTTSPAHNGRGKCRGADLVGREFMLWATSIHGCFYHLSIFFFYRINF